MTSDQQRLNEALSELEHLRERVAWLMLEEPSKTRGLYAAIDELQSPALTDEMVDRAARALHDAVCGDVKWPEPHGADWWKHCAEVAVAAALPTKRGDEP